MSRWRWTLMAAVLLCLILSIPAAVSYGLGSLKEFVLEVDESLVLVKTGVCLASLVALTALLAKEASSGDKRAKMYSLSGPVLLLAVVVAAVDMGLCAAVSTSPQEFLIALRESKTYGFLIFLTGLLGVEVALASQEPPSLARIWRNVLFFGSVSAIALFPYVSYALMQAGVPWLPSVVVGLVICLIGLCVLKKTRF